MENEEIEKTVFNDKEVDQIEDFDYCLRSAYIERTINRTEYLNIEYLREKIRAVEESLSSDGKIELREVLNNWG